MAFEDQCMEGNLCGSLFSVKHQQRVTRPATQTSHTQKQGRKQAEMTARNAERERVKLEQQEEAAKKNAEMRVKAEARISAALKNNATILAKRREDFSKKEAEAEERRRYGAPGAISRKHLHGATATKLKACIQTCAWLY